MKKEFKTKKILFVLMISLMFIFVSCGSSGDVENDGDKVVVSDSPIVNQEISIEEQVILDSNNVKVTVTGFEADNLFGPEIKVLVENNGDKSVIVQSEATSVNGIMVDSLFSVDVAAGKKANDSITLMFSDVESDLIEVIKDIDFEIYVMDSENWTRISDEVAVHIETSADESYVQTYDDTGSVLYDDGEVKIVGKKIDSTDSFWGSDVYLYLENNSSSRDITIQANDVSVNGFMVSPFFSCDIAAGKKAYDSITFMESDLTDNNITDITEIELKFHIFDTDTWKTIKDTDTIVLSFE